MVPSLEVTGQCQWVTTPVPGATNSKLSSDALGNFNVAVVVNGDPSTVHSWACAADAADPPITSTTSSAVPIRAIRLFIPLNSLLLRSHPKDHSQSPGTNQNGFGDSVY